MSNPRNSDKQKPLETDSPEINLINEMIMKRRLQQEALLKIMTSVEKPQEQKPPARSKVLKNTGKRSSRKRK